MAANSAADCEKTRCELFGEYLLENSTTVRETAKYFGMSKSTVHKDVTVRLKYEDPVLYRQVKELLQINKAQRHLRGGEATRLRYAGVHRSPHPDERKAEEKWMTEK